MRFIVCVFILLPSLLHGAGLTLDNPTFAACFLKRMASGCATPNAPSSCAVDDSDNPPDHTVTWTETGTFDGVELAVSTDGGAFVTHGAIAPGSGSAGFGSVTLGTVGDGFVYIFKARTTNACGTQSAYSNTVTNDIFYDVVYCNPFEQAAGSSKTATVDTAGFGALTEQGGTVTQNASGAKGNCSAFTSAAGHYLKSASASGNTLFAGDFTVSVWIYVTSLPAVRTDILIREAASDIKIDADSSGSARWWPDPDGDTASSGGGAVSTSTWIHIVGGVSGTSLTYYFNGADVTGGEMTASPIGGDDFLYIGAPFAGLLTLDGRVDEIAIWPRVLSQAEVTSLYGGGTASRFK